MMTKLQDCIIVNLILNKNLIAKCLIPKKITYQRIHKKNSNDKDTK